MDTLGKLKVQQLKDELSRRGEDSKGTKVVLVKRLEEILEREGVDPIAFVTEVGSLERTVGSAPDEVSERVGVMESNGGAAALDEDVPEETSRDVTKKGDQGQGAGMMFPVGNYGSADQHVSKSNGGSPAASVRSVSSRRSSCSHTSMSSLRAKEQAKKAGLLARTIMMKEKQKLQLQELEMKMKKEELELQMEIAEAGAREQVFAEHSEESNLPETCAEDAVRREPNKEDAARRQVPKEDAARRELHREDAARRQVPKEDAARKLVTKADARREEEIEEDEERKEMHKDDMTKTEMHKEDAMRGEKTEDCQREGKIITRRKAPTGRPTKESKQGQVKREETDRSGDATQAILTHFQRGQLPKAEIPVFNGDITKYRSFIRAFESRIASKTEDDEERLCYLEQFTSGKPRDIIRGCLHMTAGSGYVEARRLLDKRYGDEDSITSAFVDMVMDWPHVKPGDVEALDRFSLTLISCKNVMSGISPGAREMDHPKTMRKIIEKLPYQLQDRWRRIADNIRESHRRAKFEDVVDFIEKEVRIQTNPMFGRQHKDSRAGEPDGQRKRVQTVSATVVGAGAQQRWVSPKCLFCSKGHSLDQCEELRGKAPHEKSSFVRENGLCFGCLGRGHIARECTRRRVCSVCKRGHPTVLHIGEPPPSYGAHSTSHERSARPQNPSQVVTNGRVKLGTSRTSTGSSSTMMSIVPVKVWADDGRSVETYAFLDGGSSATFCSEALLKQLGAVGENVRLSMTTASADNQQVDSRVIKGVKISDLSGTADIAMPPMYTLETIPVRLEDMATNEDLDQWVHLQDIDLVRIDAEIGLLIGSNCPEALQPLEVRRSKDGGPFAVRTELGWVVQGPRRGCRVEDDRVKLNRIQAVKDSADLHRSFIALYNQEFGDHGSAVGLGLSREDQSWLRKVEDGVRFTDGHYEIPLPLRDEEVFPNNRQQAEQRIKGLKKRMLRDEKYLKDYSKFVNELIEKDYAEKVSRDRLDAYWGRTWYIPHHGVYHPMKPEKIRVVYDCSASYKGVSINDRLLQGPNLTSSLIGVLLRFRQEPFAVMGDVEKMFYQVRVPAKDRSLLRFLWWPDGDLSRQLEEYHMNVHLFGATSSPSCANFALRRTAQDYGSLYSPEVSKVHGTKLLC